MDTIDLLESVLWTPGEGFFLLDLHVARMETSARELGFPCCRRDIVERLEACARDLTTGVKLRLLLSRSGEVAVETAPLTAGAGALVEPLKIGVAGTFVASKDPLLRHKTTRRGPYEAALASRPECDDVVLVNERGEITEASSSNIVFTEGGCRFTPPERCGLLPGTFRAHLLRTGQIREGLLPRNSLSAGTELYLINSVRRWRHAVVADDPTMISAPFVDRHT